MRKLFTSLFIFILILPPIYGIAQSSPSIQIYFFYAEDCQPCQTILQGYLPSLKVMFPTLEIKIFNVGNPSYYEALTKLEKRSGRIENELPIIFIGDQMLSGEMEIMEKLNPMLLEAQAKGGVSPPPVQLSDSWTVTRDSEKTPVYKVELSYFYQKGCPKCDRVNVLLKYMAKKYPHLMIMETDLNTPEGKRLNETLSNRFNLPKEERLIAPAIFIGNDYLPPDEITESKVETLIQKYKRVSAVDSKTSKPTPEEIKKAEESIIARFKSLGVLAILSAGLIEGLNPCALATLIFFISYLTMVGRKRKEIFWGGMGFSASSFVTHLLLGLGILGFIQYLPSLTLFSRIIYLITLLFALSLGTLSLYDYIQLRRGQPSKMKLQVPNFLKKRIHQTIRVRSGGLQADGESHSAHFMLAAIVIGFIVTLFQFSCTSQVYLPTILFVTNIPSLRGSAVFYLILYNLVYIVPLLVIFSIVYWGISSEQLGLFLQRRASTIKLLTALFFFALAGVLIVFLL